VRNFAPIFDPTQILKVESKMADNAQIFNIGNPISLKWKKLETSNLVCALTMSSFDGKQNTRSKEKWPSLGNLDLNLRNPVNTAQMAQTTGFKVKSRSKGDIIWVTMTYF